MIKGNIVTANRWSSNLSVIDTTNETISKLENNNIDLYYFVADSNCTFLQDSILVKVKAGQIVFHKGYENTVFVFNPKDSIATVIAAIKAKEIEQEQVRKESRCGDEVACLSSN